MLKSELRKLRKLNATQGMLTEMKKSEKHNFFIRAQCLGPYVKIAIFRRSWLKKGIMTPCCETFINKDGKEWKSRILEEDGKEEKWSEAMLYNLPIFYFGDFNKLWMTNDAKITAKRFQKDEKKKQGGLWGIYKWQLKIREENILKQEQKEQQPWDEDMELIPPVPKGLEEWMHRECNKTFFMVYKYKPGQKKATCTRCWNEVTVEGLKNNAEAFCPKCGAFTTCRSEGKMMATAGTGYYHARVIQKIKGGIVERYFCRNENYGNEKEGFRKPTVYFEESVRILIEKNKKAKRYFWGNYKNKKTRWMPQEGWSGRIYGRELSAKIYPPTMAAVMKTEIMKRSSYGLWKDPPLELPQYIILEQGNPAVEKLAKIGMFALAEALIEERYDRNLLRESETELAKMLKIDNMRLKRLREMKNAGLDALLWMQREKQSDLIWPDEMIRDFDKGNIGPEALRFLPFKAMTDLQAWNYLKKQEEVTGEKMGHLINTWDDYLSMAASMKMDVQNSKIFKPKNLRKAHDEMVIMKRTKNMEEEARKIEKKWPKVNQQLKKLKKFEYKNGKYQILAPQRVLDIVREGMILQHCVHTCEYYFTRICHDESYLFFLRKTEKTDMPWYTLEVEPSGNIRQKRTTGDRQNKDFDDAIDFLKKWQQHFKKQLTKEEKELGIKADEMRKKQYQELREQAKKVWHGPLAGKLLADVLEADFMEAI